MRLLLASTFRVRLPESYSALEIPTVSFVADPGLIVSVTEREMPFSEAVIIDLTGDASEIVLIGKFARPPER